MQLASITSQRDYWLISQITYSLGMRYVWQNECQGQNPVFCVVVVTLLPGCQGVRMSVCQTVRVSGCQGVRVSGCQGVRVSGCQGVWVSGCQGVRVSGFQGVRVSGCQSVAVGRVSAVKSHGRQTESRLSKIAKKLSASF